MDYQNSEAGDITIGINRLPATNQPAKGSVLVNPGGPGGSGMELTQYFAELDFIPNSIRAEYDIIGFDPRGVGQSTAIDCVEFGIDDKRAYVANRENIDELITRSTEIADACFDKYGTYLQQLGSLNVVRDMDSIREALNEQTLNFIGYSYGTRLGGLYLQTYPEHSGSIILDASISPNSEVLILKEQGLAAIQTNLEAMLGQCGSVVMSCNKDEVQQLLETRVNHLIETGNEDEFSLVSNLLSFGIEYPEFAELLIEPLVHYLENNDRAELDAFLTVLGINEDEIEDEALSAVEIAILCADDAARPSAEVLEATLHRFNDISDLAAELVVAEAASCVGWPAALEPLPPITTRNAPSSLVIGGTSDSQTPIHWSEEMALSIGGHFISSEHAGHTAVFSDKSDCLDDIATAFILENRLPDANFCAADSN